MSDDIIIITAAGAGTWLRERFTPSGVVRWLGEGLVSDYAQKMETLRLIDDKIYEWSKDLNTYVDLMEGAFKSKRLVDLASVSLVISNTLKKVTLQEQFIKNISEESLAEFEKERGDLSSWWRDPTESPSLSEEEISSQMKNRGKNQPGGKNAQLNSSLDLIKEAGWWDDLTRKWVHRKIRSKKIQERDTELQMFFSKTKNIVSRVRNLADKLHALRASGEIGKYLDTLREISKLQNEFENDPKTGFRAIYRKHLRELVENIIKNKEGLESSEDVEDAVAEGASPDVRKGVQDAQQDDPSPFSDGYGGDSGDDGYGGDSGDDGYGGDSGANATDDLNDYEKEILKIIYTYSTWLTSISDEIFKNKSQEDKENLVKLLKNMLENCELLKTQLVQNNNNLKVIEYVENFLQQIVEKLLLWTNNNTGTGPIPSPSSSLDPTAHLPPAVFHPEKNTRFCSCGSGIIYDSCHGKEKALEILKKIPGNENKSQKQLENIFLNKFNAREKKISELEEILDPSSGKKVGKAKKEQAEKELNKIYEDFFKIYASMSKKEFITKLSSCSNQYEAANLLLKYSQEIEEHDLNTSLKLLAIAEGLLDE